MNASLPIVSALLGSIILFFGRKLFWLCVAAFGFAAGVELAPYILGPPTPHLQQTFALVLGFVGALLALLLQKLAIGLVGFGTGGKLALEVSLAFAGHDNYSWLIFLLGGIVGAILFIALFDWALIVLSSLLGAYLILGAIILPKNLATLALIGLTACGFIVQAAILRRRRAAVAD